MKPPLMLFVLITAVSAGVGFAAGRLGSGYQYALSGDAQKVATQARTVVPVRTPEASCLYRSDKYRHGEMIWLADIEVTQICVIYERGARWVTIPEVR